MNDDELDQVLKRWKSPRPSPGLRARVLAGFPRRDRLRIDRGDKPRPSCAPIGRRNRLPHQSSEFFMDFLGQNAHPNRPLRSDAPLGWGRALRWGAAMVAVVCMLAIGIAQSGGVTLENLGDGISRLDDRAINWIGDIWVGHVVRAFRESKPSIYLDGELRSDVEFGGSGVGVWVRIPGEGKYLVGLRRTAFEGTVPPRAGRFDGHALEFQAGGRTVRIESTGTYGFHQRLPVYVVGPVQR